MSDRGRLDVETLGNLAQTGDIDTVALAFCDPYGRLLGKRLDAEFFVSDVATGTHVCDYLYTVDMEMEPVPGYAFANWEEGYSDVHLVPDTSTLRVAAWLDRTAYVICDVERGPDHAPVTVDPRRILRVQIERAAELGLEAVAASELEYFLFRTTYEEAARSGFEAARPAGWYLEDYHLLQGARTEDLNGTFRRALAASGIPVEGTKGEWGRGQHELNIRHCPVLDMADRHALLKQCVKEVADAAGASASFMAKWKETEAGSGSHLHLSVWRDGANAFPGDSELSGVRCSDEFRWFLGGWMAYAPELMVLYAPTVNSYKRFRTGSWAPTEVAWSVDNRTAGFRVVGSGRNLHIENRIPGADINPYLAYAASLASGLAGIEERIEPPAAFEGDVYRSTDLSHLPLTLADALARFESSDLARRAFGADVVEHYAHFFHTELEAFEHAVTDWERARYFERI